MEKLRNKIIELKNQGFDRIKIEWTIKKDFDFVHCESKDISIAINKVFRDEK